MVEQDRSERSSFQRATELERIEELRFRATVPDGWQQGRGAFGGLVLALCARAMELSEPEVTRRLRTLSGDLCGPVLPGETELRVRVLRRGVNQSNLSVELLQAGETLATATGVFSSSRSAQAARVQPSPPSSQPWQELPVLPVRPPMGPAFANHYEYRSDGPAPFSGGSEPITAGYIREREQPTRLDAPALIACLDAWWPTLFSVETTPRLAATISFVAELLADPHALDPSQPLEHRARMVALSDGFFVEFRELWSGGALVAMNQQTFALIR